MCNAQRMCKKPNVVRRTQSRRTLPWSLCWMNRQEGGLEEHRCWALEILRHIELHLSYKPLWTSPSLSYIRSGSRSMSTTAGPAALCLTWSWGTSIPFECSAKTSVASAMSLASARTPLSLPKQVMKSPQSSALCNMIVLLLMLSNI